LGRPALAARVAILMTCFNRKEKTLKSLRSLFHQDNKVARSIQVILVDDGSTDRTSDEVVEQFPAVQILMGDGSLYWNGGMRLAFGEAMHGEFDYFLWLNDDTTLFPNALDVMLQTASELELEGKPGIVVGSTCHPDSGRRTYGGFRRVRNWCSQHYVPVEPLSDAIQACDTMNGNCTLIPKSVAVKVGNLDGAFRHRFSDMDYSLRARARGFGTYLVPGFIGACTPNLQQGTWRDTEIPFSRRWRDLMSPKGIPINEWFTFTRRHYGFLWPLYFCSPYIKTVLSW
jgi:GT2 family glycosyltransferase